MQFSTFVHKRRRLRGFTMQQLASKARFLPGYISLVESGQKNPRIGNALRLCRALGVDVGALAKIEDRYEVFGAAKKQKRAKAKRKVARGKKR